MIKRPRDPMAQENRIAKPTPQEAINLERVKELYPEGHTLCILSTNVPYTGNWDLRREKQ